MRRRAIFGTLLGLLLGWYALQLPATASSQADQQYVTQAPAGPFHISRNQIIDSKGRPLVIRGTQLTDFHPQTAARDNRAGLEYGPHSATSLSAIRLRFNMNAVRVPMDATEASQPGYFAKLAQLVRRANGIDLLVILAAREPGEMMSTQRMAEFWTRCAAYFKDYPNVMFDAGMERVAGAIRSAGAVQPILVMNWQDDQDDPNTIYEVSPNYIGTRTDADRDAQFGFLSQRVPVLANDLDLHLEDLAQCNVIPSDPSAASALVEANLTYLDAHQISSTVSIFDSGKLIKDFSLHDATTLENGWTCGKPKSDVGLGRVVQAHMRASLERGLFAVSGAGGVDIARGAFSLVYGPIMAMRDSKSLGPRAPMSLGGISMQVTDARGVTRRGGLFWASEGWGQANVVIPAESALGPARMTILRDDGSSTSTNITIADTAPGFVTGHSCRGPAVGIATQVLANGRTTTSPLSSCQGFDCRTIPVPVASGATTRVRIDSSGFRYAGSAGKIEVRIGGIRVPVVSFGPVNSPGEDQVTIEIPASMRGMGEADLICHLNGRVSNAVRIRLGGEKPIS